MDSTDEKLETCWLPRRPHGGRDTAAPFSEAADSRQMCWRRLRKHHFIPVRDQRSSPPHVQCAAPKPKSVNAPPPVLKQTALVLARLFCSQTASIMIYTRLHMCEDLSSQTITARTQDILCPGRSPSKARICRIGVTGVDRGHAQVMPGVLLAM